MHVSPRSQSGYALLVVLLAFSIFVLSLSMAIPRWKTEIQRDRETEAIDRAHQYVEGIKRYYHKFGSYPPNIERLKETNGIHYLRQAWPDPLTPDGKWKLLQFSDLKNGEIVGGGMGLPGAQGGGGAAGNNGVGPAGGLSGGTGGLGMGMSGGLGGSLGSSSGASGTGLGDSGSNPGAGLFSDGSNSDTGDSNNNPSSTTSSSSGAATAGATGAQTGTTTTGAASSSPPTSTGGLFGGTSGLGGTGGLGATGRGPVFGGTGIVGVASTSKKPGIHAFNRKSRPDQWQFVYNPMRDRSLLGPGVGNGPALGQSPGTNNGTDTIFGGTQPTSTGTSGVGSTGTGTGSGTTNPGAGLFGDSGTN